MNSDLNLQTILLLSLSRSLSSSTAALISPWYFSPGPSLCRFQGELEKASPSEPSLEKDSSGVYHKAIRTYMDNGPDFWIVIRPSPLPNPLRSRASSSWPVDASPLSCSHQIFTTSPETMTGEGDVTPSIVCVSNPCLLAHGIRHAQLCVTGPILLRTNEVPFGRIYTC